MAKLLKEAEAALLNAAAPSVAYPFTEPEIIEGVNTVLVSGNKDAIKGLTKLLKDTNDPKNCEKKDDL